MTDSRIVEILERLYVRGYCVLGGDEEIEKLLDELRREEKARLGNTLGEI